MPLLFIMDASGRAKFDGSLIEKIHYNKIISPQFTNQEYGIEDARISYIDGKYFMTTCCVSLERHSTMLYKSVDGLNYNSVGIVLSSEQGYAVVRRQNK